MISLKRIQNSVLVSAFACLIIVSTACGGESGSILDNFTSTDAKLKSLDVSVGTLCPVFDPDTTNYTLEIPASTDSINFNPIGLRSNLDIKVFAEKIKITPANDIFTVAMSNKEKVAVEIKVKSPGNASKEKKYTVEIKKIQSGMKSNNAFLAGLTISEGTLCPAFNPICTAYNVEVPKGTESVVVTPVAAGIGASIKVNDSPVVSGAASASIASSLWTNAVKIVVTAEDGTTIQTYYITLSPVTGEKSSNAKLADINLSNGSLSPAFDPNIQNYSIELPIGTTSISISSVIAGVNGSLTINNNAVKSGETTTIVDLQPGNNTITIVVTAEDGTQMTYLITATVLNTEVSTNSKLASLSLTAGSLNPAFNADSYSYTTVVVNSITSFRVIPTAFSDKATIKVNGKSVISGGQSQEIELATGETTITIVVTAENLLKTTYVIVVTREANAISSNANLRSLSISQGILTPAFSCNTLNYSTEVSSSVSSISVLPLADDVNASVKVNNSDVPNGNASSPIALNNGENTINVMVTAQNGTVKTYTIIVTKNTSAPSSNANLQLIVLSKGTLEPAFTTSNLQYNVSVSNADTSITITATASNPKSIIKINGNTVASGTPSASLPLIIGTNTFTIQVTAEDAATVKNYTVIVNRRNSDISTNANLQSLVLSAGTLSPAFSSGITSYTSSVANAVTSITVTAVTADPKASLRINGNTVISGSVHTCNLNEGFNSISISVTAEDGTPKLYSLGVTRQAPPQTANANLLNLKLTKHYVVAPDMITWYAKDIDLNFNASTLDYDVSYLYYKKLLPPCWEMLTYIELEATPADPDATVEIWDPVKNVDNAAKRIVDVGIIETFNVIVTAKDGTQKTYVVKATEKIK